MLYVIPSTLLNLMIPGQREITFKFCCFFQPRGMADLSRYLILISNSNLFMFQKIGLEKEKMDGEVMFISVFFEVRNHKSGFMFL